MDASVNLGTADGKLQLMEETLDDVRVADAVSDNNRPLDDLCWNSQSEDASWRSEIPSDPHMDNALSSSSNVTSSSAEFSRQVNPTYDPNLWIPCQKTREVLAAPRRSETPVCYTMPGVMIDGSLGDPVCELARKFAGTEISANRSRSVAETTQGLLELVATNNYRSAIDLTSKLLSSYNQGFGRAHKPSRNTEDSLKFKLAWSEMEPFGDMDAPDLYFEHFAENYGLRKGSMVPFSMRLLHAELPRFVDQAPLALGRVNHLLTVVRQILSSFDPGLTVDRNSTVALWTSRMRKIEDALARCLASMNEYQLAGKIYDRDTDAAARGLTGRLQLQLGDFNRAIAEFQNFNKTANYNDTKAKGVAAMHNAYIHVFDSNYSEALVSFQRAAQYDPLNVQAVNNAAVCLLYLGRLSEAISTLEDIIEKTPNVALLDGLCTNLCTLYELESGRSSQKKIALLNVVARVRGDAFNVHTLKLSST